MTKKIQSDLQEKLLSKFREICRQGQAENEPDEQSIFLKNFLPIQAHFRVLDPDVRIIIGDKGAGKTHLFRVLEIDQGREALVKLAKGKGLPIPQLDKTAWLIGYHTSGMEFPPGRVIGNFAKGKDPSVLQDIWLSLLVRTLLTSGKIRKTVLSALLQEVLTSRTWDMDNLNNHVTKNQGTLFAILDELEADLQTRGEFIFISYDELDRVSPGDWDALKTILRGLIQFWAAYGRRWKRIRPKLFLRRDLYKQAAIFGPDIAKIASNRAELLWQIHEFYGVAIKRLINDEDFFTYLKPAKPLFDENKVLGRMPEVSKEEDYLPVVNRLFGEYMGPDPRKGLTLRWIPNHLKDGHGRIYPRPLLRLLEEASEIEIRDRKARGTSTLIHHTAIRGALDNVSEFRVQELAQEEFPWIEAIRKKFEGRNLLVPSERWDFLKALSIDWGKEKVRPPDTTPDSLLDYLVELGIFSNRRDGRIDAGDLYLRGLHLKRKGGVARPKKVGVN